MAGVPTSPCSKPLCKTYAWPTVFRCPQSLRQYPRSHGPQKAGRFHARTRTSASLLDEVATADFPALLPAEVRDVTCEAALAMARRVQTVRLEVPSVGVPVETAYVGPDTPASSTSEPVVLLHGFDSSLLEFRQLWPLLTAAGVPAYAVDLVGWGFTDAGFAENPNLPLGPQQKRDHLFAFWKEKIKVPMAVLGTSLGGAIALDFALEHPEAVDRIVLVAPQLYVDGIGPMSRMPRFLSKMGVQVLRTVALRQMANQMAYHDKERLATDDAMRIGRLHTHLPGWTDANIAFMQSGGYSMSTRVKDVKQAVLLFWGRQDTILEPTNADRFMKDVPQARLVWLDACGHFGHLEKAEEVAQSVVPFVQKAA